MVLELDPSAKPTVRMKPAVDLGPQRQVTDHFERRFFERTESKPTWRAEHFANLKPILAKIGAEAVCRRIDNLFDAPPFNLRDRFDFATFLRNVDAVAKPAPPMPMSRGSPGNGSRVLSDDDLGRLAEEARKKGF